MSEWLSTFNEVFQRDLERLRLEGWFQKITHFLAKEGEASLNFLWEFLKHPEIPFLGKLISLILFFIFFLLALIYFWKLKILHSKIEKILYFFNPKGGKMKKRKLKEWQKIKKLFLKGDQTSLKLSLIEADRLLDEALTSMGIEGESLEEKLNQLSIKEFPEVEELKYAHFIRKKISEDKNYSLSKKEAQALLSLYENFFRSFDLI